MKTIFVALQQLNLYITPLLLSQNYKTDKIEPINCRDLSAREIVDYIIELNPWLRDVKQRIRVYVGVTENIEKCLRKHNAGEVLFRGQTASQDVAAAVEAEARRRGFYIGKVGHRGNGTNSYSIYVYAYLRDLYTIE